MSHASIVPYTSIMETTATYFLYGLLGNFIVGLLHERSETNIHEMYRIYNLLQRIKNVLNYSYMFVITD
jgi:hypothetical protein